MGWPHIGLEEGLGDRVGVGELGWRGELELEPGAASRLISASTSLYAYVAIVEEMARVSG